MFDPNGLRLSKWPFLLGDAFLLGLAWFIYGQGSGPPGKWEIVAVGVCVGGGALLGVLPFLLEYRAALKLIEVNGLGTAAERIQQLESVAAQVSGATRQWEVAQEQAEKTAATATRISESMAAEVRDFTAFMQKMNESEKATLRLEVDKLRRAEAEWLQALVRVLDHTYALHAAAERSGQPQVLQQLTQFQNACRDAARRLGLAPFVAGQEEKFDPQRHRWADGETPDAGAVIAETLATGFTFQGRLIRPALVRLRNGEAARPSAEADAPATPHAVRARESELPLEPASPA